MRTCVTRPRAIGAALIAVIAVAAAAPGGALAGRADGPYTPFPDRPDDQALDYVNRLNERSAGPGGARKVTPQQLAEGVSIPSGVDPSGRAGGKGGRGESADRSDDGRGRSTNRSDDGAGSAASPFGRAGFSPASPPPEQNVVPFLALGGLLGLAAVAVGVYRVRRRWAP